MVPHWLWMAGTATMLWWFSRKGAVLETGIASWYGPGYQGRTTANGEMFDMEKMTAAHKTLPFGTVVEVRNVENGSTAVVRINDRGPFVKGRIIDLSRAAGERIGILGKGVAQVEIRLVSSQPKK